MHLYCSNSLRFLSCSAARPSFSLSSLHFVPYSGPARFALQVLCLCCPLSLCLCCLPSFVVVPVSVLPAFPAPRVVLFVLWSSLHLGVLVPPSGYLVAAVTALLPCFHAGSVVKLCYPSVIRLMATKAASPVWGFHPLHHVTGDVGELSSAILRYSL